MTITQPEPRSIALIQRASLAVLFMLLSCLARADVQVFTLVNPHPEEVLNAVQHLYGDKLQVELVQQRLLVVGSSAQLKDIATLLNQIDQAPTALHLTLSQQAPADDDGGSSTTYSAGAKTTVIDTVSGAMVGIDYQKVAQEPGGNGFWIGVENVPTQFTSLTLQIRLVGTTGVQVLVSYAKQENQEHKVFSNTATGRLHDWMPLLPQQGSDLGSDTVATGARGSQLYLRVDTAASQSLH